jgi:hypothetical protein
MSDQTNTFVGTTDANQNTTVGTSGRNQTNVNGGGKGSNAFTSTLVTGINNTSCGYFSEQNLTSGSFNTAYGSQTLVNITDSSANSAFGYQALQNLNGRTGCNTAFGANSLQSLTTGYLTTAVGYNSLPKNTIGDYNTAIGSNSLASSEVGTFNTAIGASTLYNMAPRFPGDGTTKEFGPPEFCNANTALGSNAGEYDLAGQCNTYLGASSGPTYADLKNALLYRNCTAVGYGVNFYQNGWNGNISPNTEPYLKPDGTTGAFSYVANQVVIGPTGGSVIVQGSLYVLGSGTYGNTGPQGPQGHTGPQGYGTTGFTGYTGPQGYGTTGFTGPVGPQGATGSSASLDANIKCITLEASGLISANGGIDVNNDSGLTLTNGSLTVGGRIYTDFITSNTGGITIEPSIQFGENGIGSQTTNTMFGTLNISNNLGTTDFGKLTVDNKITAKNGIDLTYGDLTTTGGSVYIKNDGFTTYGFLTVESLITASGGLTANNNSSISADATITAGGLITGGGGFSTDAETALSTSAQKALVQTNYIRANDNAPITKTVQVQGTLDVSDNLNVGLDTSLTGALTVGGLTTAGNGINITSGGLKITNADLTIITGGISCGAITIVPGADLNVSGGNTDLNGTLTVGGLITANDGIKINGNLSAESFTATSDYRIKENVQPIVDVVPELTIDKLNPVLYLNTKTQKQDMGFLAHELAEQFPFLVIGEKDGEENQSVNYLGLIALLVKEVQELKKVVNSKL